MRSIDDLKKTTDVPIVIADRSGRVVYVNQCFLDTYRWTEALIGSSLTRIIPAHFHDSHNMGFSRILVTGISRISGHLIEAPVVMGDGRLKWSRHLIRVDESDGEMVIWACLTPMDSDAAPHPSADPSESQPFLAQTMDELRATMGKMEVALGEVKDAIVWTDDRGHLHWCNEAFDRLVGREHLSILGADFSEVVTLRFQDAAADFADHPIRRLIDRGPGRHEIEADIQGVREVLEISCSEFLPGGARMSVILVLRVVTQKRRMTDAQTVSCKRMEDELRFGRDIQMSILPTEPPLRPEFSLGTLIQPAMEVGGDFYDHFFIRPDQLCFCIGDVSGKGVPAALLMAVTQTLIRNHGPRKNTPAEIVRRVNQEICAHNRSDMYISLFLAVLDVKSGRLAFTNAGHNPPFMRKHDGTVRLIKDRHGPILGYSESVVYGEGAIRMEPGDGLLAYTDGVTEAMNTTEECYTIERLTRCLEGIDWSTPAAAIDAVGTDLGLFRGKAARSDDITLICLKYEGRSLDYQI